MTRDIPLSICVTFPGINTFILTSTCRFKYNRTSNFFVILYLFPLLSEKFGSVAVSVDLFRS